MAITECRSERFLASYLDWFNLLLQHIQPSGVSQLVEVASCAAVSDLLSRLGTFSNLKKEGNAQAGKLVQPILKILNEDATEAVLEVAGHLLSSIITYFPAAVLRYHDNVEGAIVSRIMSGNCSAVLLKKLASCLALLPRSRGDEESWSLMMQKILFSTSRLLNDALEGLEEDSVRNEGIALLFPPGKDPPPSLGGQMNVGESLNKGERSQQLLISTISSLMNCCCTILTSFYPVQVAVPIRPILATVRRVLMVSGSLPESLQPFTTAMQQEFVCTQLPALQLCSLEVLAAVVKGMHCQLLPHAGDIVRILMGCFKRCWLPELRTKLYSIVKDLLILMGAGMALYISQEVISNGFIDLKLAGPGSDGACVSEVLPIEATSQRQPKKRKHGTVTALPVEQHASFGSGVKASKESPTSIALKIAAVEALEALLIVGGALRSDSWRRRVDHLLIEVATNAFRMGWTHDGKPFLPQEPKVTWEDFQLAALHALLASLLSPAGTRPPYLAQGLELFRKGKSGTGTKIAEFCAQALLALEVLVHPRALPFIDISSGMADFGGQKYKSPLVDGKIRTGNYGIPHDIYDFMNDVYLQNNSGSEVLPAECNKRLHCDKKSVDISRSQDLEPQNIVSPPLNMSTPGKRAGPAPTPCNVQIEANGDRVMQDVEHHDNPDKASREPDLTTAREDLVPTSSLGTKRGLEEDVSDAETPASPRRPSESSGQGPASIGCESIPGAEGVVSARGDDNVFKVSAAEADDESDSFPDIVDADPDTDSGSE